jgi:hypothetical protein
MKIDDERKDRLKKMLNKMTEKRGKSFKPGRKDKLSKLLWMMQI